MLEHELFTKALEDMSSSDERANRRKRFPLYAITCCETTQIKIRKTNINMFGISLYLSEIHTIDSIFSPNY
jgi:hypothetical protein